MPLYVGGSKSCLKALAIITGAGRVQTTDRSLRTAHGDEIPRRNGTSNGRACGPQSASEAGTSVRSDLER